MAEGDSGPDGFEITEGQRAYLRAFDAWLLNPTQLNERRRKRELVHITTAAGVDISAPSHPHYGRSAA